jgi:hypothetical protein
MASLQDDGETRARATANTNARNGMVDSKCQYDLKASAATQAKELAWTLVLSNP